MGWAFLGPAHSLLDRCADGPGGVSARVLAIGHEQLLSVDIREMVGALPLALSRTAMNARISDRLPRAVRRTLERVR